MDNPSLAEAHLAQDNDDDDEDEDDSEDHASYQQHLERQGMVAGPRKTATQEVIDNSVGCL